MFCHFGRFANYWRGILQWHAVIPKCLSRPLHLLVLVYFMCSMTHWFFLSLYVSGFGLFFFNNSFHIFFWPFDAWIFTNCDVFLPGELLGSEYLLERYLSSTDTVSLNLFTWLREMFVEFEAFGKFQWDIITNCRASPLEWKWTYFMKLFSSYENSRNIENWWLILVKITFKEHDNFSVASVLTSKFES